MNVCFILIFSSSHKYWGVLPHFWEQGIRGIKNADNYGSFSSTQHLMTGHPFQTSEIISSCYILKETKIFKHLPWKNDTCQKKKKNRIKYVFIHFKGHILYFHLTENNHLAFLVSFLAFCFPYY